MQMPYLDTETEAYVTREADMKCRAHIKAPQCDPYIRFKRLDDLVEAYSCSGSIHVPRSLDQSYYIGLDSVEDSVDHDLNQVVYKYTGAQLAYSEECIGKEKNPTVYRFQKARQLYRIRAAQINCLANSRVVEGPKLLVPPTQAKILMVNQLWLWVLDESKLIVWSKNLCAAR
jgi:hypothetical protein